MSREHSPVLPAGLVLTLAAFLFGLTAGRELPTPLTDLAVPTACVAALSFAAFRMAAVRFRRSDVAGGAERVDLLESRFERHLASRPHGPHRRAHVKWRRMIH
ncbi:MAG: hypothetical protein AAF532_06010 [Planctomycetota bacterium]